MATISKPPFRATPLRVIFEGFESDTHRMGAAGWQLNSNEIEDSDRFDLHAYHSAMKIAILFRDIHTRRAAEASYYYHRNAAIFDGPYVGIRVSLDWIAPAYYDMSKFYPASHVPAFETSRYSFTPLEAQTIIIEPKDVQECLDRIAKLQAPEMARLREGQRKQVINISTF